MAIIMLQPHYTFRHDQMTLIGKLIRGVRKSDARAEVKNIINQLVEGNIE